MFRSKKVRKFQIRLTQREFECLKAKAVAERTTVTELLLRHALTREERLGQIESIVVQALLGGLQRQGAPR